RMPNGTDRPPVRRLLVTHWFQLKISALPDPGPAHGRSPTHEPTHRIRVIDRILCPLIREAEPHPQHVHPPHGLYRYHLTSPLTGAIRVIALLNRTLPDLPGVELSAPKTLHAWNPDAIYRTQYH